MNLTEEQKDFIQRNELKSEQFKAVVHFWGETDCNVKLKSVEVIKGQLLKNEYLEIGQELVDHLENFTEYPVPADINFVDPTMMRLGDKLYVSGVFATDKTVTIEFFNLVWSECK